MIILWDQGAYAPPYGYQGLGYVWTWAGTLGADAVVTPNICITLAAVSQLDVTLAAVSRLDVTLTDTSRLDVTLEEASC